MYTSSMVCRQLQHSRHGAPPSRHVCACSWVARPRRCTTVICAAQMWRLTHTIWIIWDYMDYMGYIWGFRKNKAIPSHHPYLQMDFP